jgi:hypothetical protein
VSDVSPPLPAFASWPTFPFEGELRVKQLEDPVAEEPPRHGEDPAECSACRAPDGAYIWVSERWRVRALDRPTGLPMVLILESRSHLDLGDLPNLLAAELGVLTVRLERAIRSLDGVARVHVNRWGDGSAHLHMWFLARPYGRLQLRGTFLSLWDDILPRVAEGRWRENLAMIAAWLAEFGGRAIAEPPHIDWQAPARFNLPVGAEATGAGTGSGDDEDRDDDGDGDEASNEAPRVDGAIRIDAVEGDGESAAVSDADARPGSSGDGARPGARGPALEADAADSAEPADGGQSDSGETRRERPRLPAARKTAEKVTRENASAPLSERETGGDAIASGLTAGR